MNKHVARGMWYSLTFIPLVLLVIGYIYPSSFFSSQESVRDLVNGAGTAAPIVFILIQILQVIITPISHYVVGIAGGYMFGVWDGFLYNWIGRIIGTAIAFLLARHVGRRIVKNVVQENTLRKYDSLFDKRVAAPLLFLMYFLPLFPDDELSYLAGLSGMSGTAFFIVMMLGHIGGSLGLAYIGAGRVNDLLFYVLLGITLLFGVLFAFYWRRLRHETHR